jgi:hypothetical protein
MLGTTSTVAARGDDSRFDRTLIFSGDVTGTGASSTSISLTVLDDSHNHTLANGNFTILGNLVVSGATITLASQNAILYDPILTLGGSGVPTFDDGKDRGIEFKYFNGTAKTGFFGFDDSTGYFTFIPDATNTNEAFTGTMGDIQATNFRGNLIGNANSSSTSVFASQALSANSANHLFGGSANQIPIQSGIGATTFVTTTGTGNVVLQTAPQINAPSISGASFDVHTVIASSTITTTTTTPNQVLATAPSGTYRSGEFMVSATDITGNKYHVTKLLAVHNGLNPLHTEYGTLIFGSSCGDFSVDFSFPGLRLLVTPSSTNSTIFKVSSILTRV